MKQVTLYQKLYQICSVGTCMGDVYLFSLPTREAHEVREINTFASVEFQDFLGRVERHRPTSSSLRQPSSVFIIGPSTTTAKLQYQRNNLLSNALRLQQRRTREKERRGTCGLNLLAQRQYARTSLLQPRNP